MTSLFAAETAQLPPLTTVSGSPRLPGKFVWADLVTDDVAAAQTFYGRLFGWTFRGVGNYSIAANDERPLAGLFQLTRPKDRPEAKPRWFGYISVAERHGVRSLSGLARHAPSLSLASDYEFFTRTEWRAVEGTYGLAFRERRTMDPSLLYQAIASRQVDVATAYSSDGRIDALGLVVLDDDRGAIPAYDAVVLASPRLAREDPDILAAVRRLENAIDVARMRALNRLVDEQGLSPAAVARGFLSGRARQR